MLAFNFFIFQTVLIDVVLCQIKLPVKPLFGLIAPNKSRAIIKFPIKLNMFRTSRNIKIPVTLVTMFGRESRNMFNLRYDFNFSPTVPGTILESEYFEATTTDFLNLSTFDPTIPSVNISLDITTTEIEKQLETTTPQMNLRHENDEVTVNPNFLRMLPTPPIVEFELITFANPALRMAPIPKEFQTEYEKIPLPSASFKHSSNFNTIMQLYTNILQQTTLLEANYKNTLKNLKKPLPDPESYILLSDQKTNTNTVTKNPRKNPTKSKKSLSTTTTRNPVHKKEQVKLDNQNKIVNKSAEASNVKKKNTVSNKLGEKSENVTTRMPNI